MNFSNFFKVTDKSDIEKSFDIESGKVTDSIDYIRGYRAGEISTLVGMSNCESTKDISRTLAKGYLKDEKYSDYKETLEKISTNF